jgi:hypothetical protein
MPDIHILAKHVDSPSSAYCPNIWQFASNRWEFPHSSVHSTTGLKCLETVEVVQIAETVEIVEAVNSAHSSHFCQKVDWSNSQIGKQANR